MSYIVSARKYRPQTFEDVVGQEQITTTLKRSIENDHLAQAFLFCGPRGVGKTTCARIMAKAVNTGKTENLDQIEEDFSFNIFELDAASNNKVDDMHQLIAQVRIPPQTGKFKIYIIDEVHMLSQAAFNAFLKTLEEPPPYAIFILATTEKHKILPTILSRCQIYDFKRISVADIVGHLKNIANQENIQAEDNALHIVAEKADGALRDALSIFDRLVSFSGNKLTYEDAVKNLNVLDHDYFFKITEQLLSADLPSAILELDNIISNGFEGDQFMSGLSNHFRNLMVCKDERTIKLLEVSNDLKQKYFVQSKIAPLEFLVNALSLASDCDVNYAQSIHKRLLVETTLMKMAYLNNAVKIEEANYTNNSEKKKPEHRVETKNSTSAASSAAIEKPIVEPKPNIEEKEAEETATENETPKIEVKNENSVSFTLADLEAEVENELKNKGTDNGTIDELSAVAQGSLKLNEENLLKVWEDLFVHLSEENYQTLLQSIDDKTPELKGNEITVLADSKVEKTLIEKDIFIIKKWFKQHFETNDYEIVIKVPKNAVPKKIVLNPKDIFIKMANENENIITLRNNLDLELDI